MSSVQKDHCDVFLFVEYGVDVVKVVLQGFAWHACRTGLVASLRWFDIVGLLFSSRQNVDRKLADNEQKEKLTFHAGTG